MSGVMVTAMEKVNAFGSDIAINTKVIGMMVLAVMIIPKLAIFEGDFENNFWTKGKRVYSNNGDTYEGDYQEANIHRRSIKSGLGIYHFCREQFMKDNLKVINGMFHLPSPLPPSSSLFLL